MRPPLLWAMRLSRISAVTMTTLIALAVATTTTLATAREWTSSDGRKIQAELVAVAPAGDQVTLKLATGQTATVALARLSAADQAFIKAQPPAAVAATAGSPAAPGAAAGPAKAVSGPYAELITGDWALSTYKDLPFALYGAKDLNAAQTYPLVLALHGKSPNTENGKQVGGWMKSFAKEENFKKNPCIVLAPMCYQPYGGSGSGWSDKPGLEAVALVKELLKTLPIDKERIYVVGHSMGGFGTCHLINTENRLFTAGVAVAGCTGPETAGSFKKVPLWLFHAADDANVEVRCSRALAEALKRDKECKYTEYPSGGHGIMGKVFEDPEVHTWLFAQGVGKKG